MNTSLKASGGGSVITQQSLRPEPAPGPYDGGSSPRPGRQRNHLVRRLLANQIAWILLVAMLLLCSASIAALRVVSARMAHVQELHILVGLAGLFIVLVPSYRSIGRYSYVFYAVSLALLAGVLFAPAIKGSHRWFVLGAGVNLQPSELAKIAFVMAVAWSLRRHRDCRELSRLLTPFVLMLLPMGLILKESDLGTALLFPMALYCMLIAAGARFRHLLAIALIVLSIAPGCYPLLKSYQKQRIIAMLVQRKPTYHQLHGDLYQQQQSEIAEGSGGVVGQGLAGANQIRHGLLPEAGNDFVFAVVATQWGFAGGAGVLLLYVVFFGGCMETAGSAPDSFARLLVVGLASMLILQATINIAMTTGLIPVVGITLPFLSYGGSAIVTDMLATGLILNVALRRERPLAPL